MTDTEFAIILGGLAFALFTGAGLMAVFLSTRDVPHK